MRLFFFALIYFSFYSISLFSQTISPAPPDKAVVYFARPSGLGFAVNFSYFDSTKLIGRFNGGRYIRYECAPGKHLLWARSENRDFIEAELDAGKIYFIEAEPIMGAFKAGVDLVAIDPNNPKSMKNILKLLAKKPAVSFTEEQLAEDTKDLKDVIQRGIAKYVEDKSKGKTLRRLEKSNYYNGQLAQQQ